MIYQYSGSYSNPPADVRDLIANKVNLLDSYIVLQSNTSEYSAIVFNNITGTGKEYTIKRSGNNNYYTVSSKDVDTFEYAVVNEYYVYSNAGIGKPLDLPVMEGVQAHGVAILTIVVLFAIVFKGALFKWFRRK